MFSVGCSKQNFQTVNDENSFLAAATYNANVDILWVVDNSHENMEVHQNRIATKMQAFYDGLIANKTNFRIAATTMDMSNSGAQGDLLGSVPVVTRATPNAVARLSDLLKRGGEGANAEIGLGAMKMALEKETSKGNAAKFLREDALLVIVFVTDDKDFSVGTPNDYKLFLDGLKGENSLGSQKWIANYIGVTDLNDPNCRTYGDYAVRGEDYIELAQGSGGVSDSICNTDFSSYIDQITLRLKSVLNRYKLEDIPILDSLTVYKNGVSVREDKTNGWIYEAEKNTIVLNGSAKPGPNDDIEIKFEIKTKLKN
jgi:hypothetical protein